jgi:hypothetical protein
MKVTPYNKDETIEMLRARIFKLLMSGECGTLEGEHSAPLFELCGDMTFEQADEAIEAWEATQ